MSHFNAEQIIELAKIMEDEADRIAWDTLPLDRDTVYAQLATNVLETMLAAESQEKREVILGAAVTQLLVLNFVQNIEIELMKKNR